MSQVVNIEVQHRDEIGKNESRRLRAQGLIPAVVYGGGREPEGVMVDPRPIDAVLHSERGRNTLIHLRIGDRELQRMVLIREVQRHPVTDRLMHADFVRVEMDRKVEVSVPVNFVGTPLGVKNEGGLLDYIRRQVMIKVLPAAIPESLDADISALHAGQHLEAGKIQLPEGIELVTPPTDTLVTVIGKAKAEATYETPAAPVAEPEVTEQKDETAKK